MSANSLVMAGLCLLAFYFAADGQYGKSWRVMVMAVGYVIGALAMRAVLS